MGKGCLGSIAILLVSAAIGSAQPAPEDPGANQGPVRYSRNNAFGPRYTYNGENAFAEQQVTPSDFMDNAFTTVAPGHACAWVDADFLLWFFHKPLPPLVTTSTPISQGVLGPGTTVLFGGTNIENETHTGARGTAGFWICHGIGVEVSGFFLSQRGTDFLGQSDGTGNVASNPLLARPTINSLTGANDRSLVTFPGAFAGNITVATPSRLWSSEGSVVYNPFASTYNWPEVIAGFRYLNLQEGVNIASQTTVLPGGLAFFNGTLLRTGNTLTNIDSFRTQNQFYGSQIGLRGRHELCQCMFVDVSVKVGFGGTHQAITISGESSLTPPGGPTRTLGSGLLALSSNEGHFTHNAFSFISEADFNIGYRVNACTRVSIGYGGLYWSNVVQPGPQISRLVNPTLDPRSGAFGAQAGSPSPVLFFKETNFWAHGMNVCVGFDF